jgi:hypothetical protein
MFRNEHVCAVANVNEFDAEAVAFLEQDPAAANAHFDKVALQLKRSNFLQGIVLDGDSDELGFLVLKETKQMAGYLAITPAKPQTKLDYLRRC